MLRDNDYQASDKTDLVDVSDQHAANWSHFTNSSVSGSGIAPQGGANPFLMSGKTNQQDTHHKYMGGTMIVEIVTNYEGMVSILSSGVDEHPRAHGRKHSVTNPNEIEMEFTDMPRFGYTGSTLNDIIDTSNVVVMGGNQRCMFVVPCPAIHHNYVVGEDQADGQSNALKFHTGSMKACLYQASGLFAAVLSAGTAVINVTLVTEHALVLDEDSILMGLATSTTRPAMSVDRMIGGFSGSGANYKEAVAASSQRSLVAAVQGGALTAPEARAAQQLVERAAASAHMGSGVQAVKPATPLGFLDSLKATASGILSSVGGKLKDAALNVGKNALEDLAEMAIGLVL
jgi:hypothetical protein